MTYYTLHYHACSGEAFILAQRDGEIVAAAGPLHYEEEHAVTQLTVDPRDHIGNMDAEERATSAAWAKTQDWRQLS